MMYRADDPEFPKPGTVLYPKYVLTLDDLPKVVEANGVVYPIYLGIRECSRLFGVQPRWLAEALKDPAFPVRAFVMDKRAFIPVADLRDHLHATTDIFYDVPSESEPESAESEFYILPD